MRKIDENIEKKVIDLYINNNMNSTDISNKLNISFNSVLRIVKRNGYVIRKTSDVNRGVKREKCVPVSEVIELYVKQNKSSMEIAKLLGCSDVTVLNILKENNIQKRKNSFYLKKAFDENKAKNLYLNGYSVMQVAKEIGSTYSCVRDFLKKNDLIKTENSYILRRGKKMSKEVCDKISKTKKENKEQGLYDHIYLKKTGLTYAEFQKQLPAFKKYFNEVRVVTNKQPLSTLLNFEKRGKMGEEGAYNIDHKYSIIEGFKNKIDPIIIGNIVNLEMITWEENNLKHGKCSISLKELKKLMRIL